jgi:long-chain fatty acid transport protein
MTLRILSTAAWWACLVAFGPTGAAWAGGFYVPEIGTRALGMASALTADAGSPAAAFHNPAGLIGIRTTQVELGATLVLPEIKYFRRPVRDPNTAAEVSFAGSRNSNGVGAIPFAAATFDLGLPDLSLGLALFVPFGATLNYPADGAQRFVVTDIALRTVYAGPALAYRVTQRLSVGISVSYVYADFQLRQSNALQFVTGDPEATPNPDPGVEGRTSLEARDPFSLGIGAGILYGLPSDGFSIGASVLLPTTLDLRGDAVVANPSIGAIDREPGGNLPAGSRSDRFGAKVPLPLVLRVGAVVRPSDRISIALDVNWQRWSTNQKLVIDFDNEYPLLLTPGATMSDVVMDNRWRDTLTVRLGTEGTPLRGLPLVLRAGALYDQSPIEDRRFDLLTPDSDKLGLSVGASYTLGAITGKRLRVDVGFLQLLFAERDINPSDQIDASSGRPYPGSDRTILNKPAPSFFYGVTRANVRLISLATTLLF